MAKNANDRNRWRRWCQSSIGTAVVALVGCHGAEKQDDAGIKQLDPGVRTLLTAPPAQVSVTPTVNQTTGMDYRKSFNRLQPNVTQADTTANAGLSPTGYQRTVPAPSASTSMAQQPISPGIEQVSASVPIAVSNPVVQAEPVKPDPIRVTEPARPAYVTATGTSRPAAMPLENPLPPEPPSMSAGWTTPLDGAGWQGSPTASSTATNPVVVAAPSNLVSPVTPAPNVATSTLAPMPLPVAPPQLSTVPSATDSSHPLPLPRLPEPITR